MPEPCSAPDPEGRLYRLGNTVRYAYAPPSRARGAVFWHARRIETEPWRFCVSARRASGTLGGRGPGGTDREEHAFWVFADRTTGGRDRGLRRRFGVRRAGFRRRTGWATDRPGHGSPACSVADPTRR